ncbi:uncharacterized protein DC041_0001382 [Schistosoma bovis]|uniref:Uncharacterized protein n=1 Tax=Schistosoma bovis TaxID=6184 RepID=A0A430QMA1_SCHBO|nr:uncharacterized protein DC041_0001382 [Schistosoma bovis]
MGSKFTDVCYLTNRHDLDLLGLDWIAHVDTLNKLLDEVCSQNVSYESIQIPNDISKSNASDESSSLDINELNASDETCSYDLSESNNSNVMCSHHVKSNTADSLPSHKISKSNTSDKVCASETSESHVLLSNVMSTSKSSASSQLSSVSYINHLRQILPVTATQIAEHTRRDPILRRVSTFIQRGWPPRITSHELKQYYQRRQSLSIVNEIMFGRKVKTALDAMKPQQIDIGKRNRKMENQFDRHHGAKRRIFQRNQKVYVRDFRYSPPQWTSGCILKRQGNVMYVVEVEGQKWTRHVNHILENAGTSQKTEKLDSMWRIILDSFDIKCSATQKTTQPEQAPIRKASRKRRRPDILQVDPKRRTYVSEGRYQ